MASSPPPEQQQQQVASSEQLGTPDKDLSAPAGWQKKIASLKSGGTPKRGAVYFIAPDGEEIKSKRSLEVYLKSHPSGPSVTEFDWGTGETPRRSSRLSTKTKSPLDTPESGSGRKRPRRKVLAEDEAPQNEGTAGPEDAPSAKADELMKDVEKVEEFKNVENIKSVEKIEDAKTVETITTVEKIAEKTESVEKIEECKTVEKGKESITVEKIEEGKEAEAVQQKENGPEEELDKQEATPLNEQSKPDQMQVSMGKNTAGEVFPKGCEVTDGEKNAPCEQEHKEQEASEKPSSGFPQFSEAPNASRPVGLSV